MIDPGRQVMTDEGRVRRLSRPRPAPTRMVLDTDAYNEIDDQFALVHILVSPDRADLQAVYAAPFSNSRSAGPDDGMRRSLGEIRRILAAHRGPPVPTYEGATAWLAASAAPSPNPAAADLVARALKADPSPLYVVAIGAATNVATALLLEPRVADHVVVVWLGGNALSWPTAREFNLQQDLTASRVLLDSGVPIVHVPCLGVADHLITTRAEIDRYVRPAGPLGALLADIYAEAIADEPGRSKVIWDLAATAWLLEPAWTTTSFASTPMVTSEVTWSFDPARHLMLEMTAVDRDAIFKDLFARLAGDAARA